jgi:hypothetical protein
LILQILLATISSDDAQRKPAEVCNRSHALSPHTLQALIDEWLKQPDTMTQHFIQSIVHSPSMEARLQHCYGAPLTDRQIRQIGTVLYRRYVFTIVEDSLWPRSADATKEMVKSELLQALLTCVCVSEPRPF